MLVRVLSFPINLWDWLVNLPLTFKMYRGCPNSFFHDFQWNMGDHDWWMYCIKCGKAVSDD
jgi:hypothetical protein